MISLRVEGSLKTKVVQVKIKWGLNLTKRGFSLVWDTLTQSEMVRARDIPQMLPSKKPNLNCSPRARPLTIMLRCRMEARGERWLQQIDKSTEDWTVADLKRDPSLKLWMFRLFRLLLSSSLISTETVWFKSEIKLRAWSKTSTTLTTMSSCQDSFRRGIRSCCLTFSKTLIFSRCALVSFHYIMLNSWE